MSKSQPTRLITTPWLLIAIVIGGLTASYETVTERFGEVQQEHQDSNSAKKAAEEQKEHLDSQAQLAMARISGNCVILFNHGTGVPARNLNSTYELVNPDGVALTVGQPVCAANGETGLVLRRDDRLVVGDKASIPIAQLGEYKAFYDLYPEVIRYESSNNPQP